MSETPVEDKTLLEIKDLAVKIIRGEAIYNTEREEYLEAVIEAQISNAHKIRDLVEDIGL